MKHTVFFFLLLFCGIAGADCTYNGVTYPEGTIIGPFVCNNGQWVPR
jgi:hypothetical protein